MIKAIKEAENVITKVCTRKLIFSYLAYILLKKKRNQKVINTSKLGKNI